MTMSSQNTLRVARDCIEALNQGDKERLKANLAPDAVWHSAATGETIEGGDNIARNLFGYRGTFPDLHEEITNAFASEDQAVAETMVTGTYEGTAVPTIPGSGKHITFPLCYLFRVQAGKVARITTYMDYRTMMSELDMLIS
jgi:steroid delta-isomerase-like uncharacterized protein